VCYDQQMIEEIPIGAEWKRFRCDCGHEFFSKDMPELCPRNTCRRVAQPKTPNGTASYNEWRLEKLSDPVRAARYLNAAKKDSKEALLYALKNVIQANQVAKIAREAGISRESVYRSFSAEGNPTFDTLSDVLVALDIDYEFMPKAYAGARSPVRTQSNTPEAREPSQ
jgi:probable addiction module antidote protein